MEDSDSDFLNIILATCRSQFSEMEMENEEVPFVRDKRKGKAKFEETDQQSKVMEAEGVMVRDKRKGKANLEETDQQSKAMNAEGVIVRDKRKGKAKVEETDEQSLPESAPIVSNVLCNDVCYLKLIGQRRVNTYSSAEGVERKFFRVRNHDVPNILGEADESLRNIHRASRATIGIISDPEVKIHGHSYLELLGTPNEVKIAELLIVDAITETYGHPFIPTALMPSDVCHHRMTIPISKVVSVLGIDCNNIEMLESQSGGAWIELHTFHTPEDVKTGERVVDIYGDELQITKAIELIMGVISGGSLESENNWPVLLDTILEEGEHQESAMLEDEKQEEDGSGEKSAHTQIGIPQQGEEDEDKESGPSGSATQTQV